MLMQNLMPSLKPSVFPSKEGMRVENASHSGDHSSWGINLEQILRPIPCLLLLLQVITPSIRPFK